LYRRGGRGTSTVLGTLIFVGIMFTAVIPMLLVMRQADTLHEMRKHELECLDKERAMESLCLYVCPQDIDSPYVDVMIVNKGYFVAHVIKIWINDEYEIVNVEIPSMLEETLDPFEITRVEGAEYDIRAMTDRGNVYTSETGILSYHDGKWVTETLGIRLIFPSRPGKGSRTNRWLNELRVTIVDEDIIELYSDYTMYWAISASENFFELESVGTYNVIIDIWCKEGGGYSEKHWEMIYDGSHSITWPIGDPIIEIKFQIAGDNLIVP